MPARDMVLRWIEEAARVIERLLYGPDAVDLEQAKGSAEAAATRARAAAFARAAVVRHPAPPPAWREWAEAMENGPEPVRA